MPPAPPEDAASEAGQTWVARATTDNSGTASFPLQFPGYAYCAVEQAAPAITNWPLASADSGAGGSTATPPALTTIVVARRRGDHLGGAASTRCSRAPASRVPPMTSSSRATRRRAPTRLSPLILPGRRTGRHLVRPRHERRLGQPALRHPGRLRLVPARSAGPAELSGGPGAPLHRHLDHQFPGRRRLGRPARDTGHRLCLRPQVQLPRSLNRGTRRPL